MGDEGGFAPNIGSNEEGLNLVNQAIEVGAVMCSGWWEPAAVALTRADGWRLTGHTWAQTGSAAGVDGSAHALRRSPRCSRVAHGSPGSLRCRRRGTRAR